MIDSAAGWGQNPAAPGLPLHSTEAPPKLLIMVGVLLLFFIQMGGYTIFSVGFIAFLFTICMLGTGASMHGLFAAVLTVPLVFANLYPFLGEPELTGAVFRTARELAVMGVMAGAASFGGWSRIDRDSTDSYLVFALVVLCLLAGVQFFCLQVYRTPMFFLDWRLYGNIGGVAGEDGYQLTTLPGYWAEFGAEHGLVLGEQMRIRASAFYSEPSYLGLVVCALIFAMTHGRPWNKRFVLPVVLALLTVAFAQTASGLICLVAYLGIQFRERLLHHAHLVAVLLVPGAIYLLSDAIDRLMSIGDADAEFSGFIRLIKPLENIVDIFSSGFLFGVPPAFVDRYISATEFGPEMGIGLDTGLFNLIIFFGLGGVGVLLLMVRILKPLELLFFVIVGVNNGSLFGFDKAFIVGMAIAYGRCTAGGAAAAAGLVLQAVSGQASRGRPDPHRPTP